MQLTLRQRATFIVAPLFLAVVAVGAERAAADFPAQPQPPAEAFDACQGKSTTEACSVAMQDRTVDGACVPADDNRLFCRPTRPPHGPPTPPREAFTSCTGKTANATCSVALPDRTVEGTCATSQEGQLFCMPSHPPPQAR